MANLKEIFEKLEKLESNEDKLDYLKSILKELDDEDDKDLIEEINNLIEEMEEGLEKKLENIEAPARRLTREIDLSEIEQDVEQIQRNVSSQRTSRPDLTVRQIDDDETSFSYQNNTNYSNAQLYSPSQFNYEALQRSSENDFIKQNLIRESVLSPERAITETEKENLSKRLRETMPGKSEEEIFMYQAKITEELKKDEKSKYIARLK